MSIKLSDLAGYVHSGRELRVRLPGGGEFVPVAIERHADGLPVLVLGPDAVPTEVYLLARVDGEGRDERYSLETVHATPAGAEGELARMRAAGTVPAGAEYQIDSFEVRP